MAGMFTITSHKNETLHWAYLEFACRSANARLSATRPPSISAPRNVVEAIRYSHDFVDAAVEFAYVLVKDPSGRKPLPDTWLTRFMDRQWKSLSLGDKLGMLSFASSGEPFWANDQQRQLFDDLRSLRNALTHPGVFGVEVEEE